jgi:transcriptional enhancer factor
VLPADVPLLEDTPVSASSSQHRGVLQKRFANWPQEYSHSSTLSRLKQSCSPSPAPNVYAQRAVPAGTYYTGNVHAQHIGLAGFGIEKPEKQVMRELEDLYKLLGKSDKYMKYREKQPSMTPDEVIARDAADKKERERKKAEGIKPDQKDTAVWPDFLEHAFWKGRVAMISQQHFFISSISCNQFRQNVLSFLYAIENPSIPVCLS